MSKLKDLFKQHGLTTAKNLIRDENRYSYSYSYNKQPQGPDPVWAPKRALLIQTYGDKVHAEEKYAHAAIHCKGKNNYDCVHYIYGNGDSFAYSWPGNHYLISKTPIPIDVFHELVKVKEAELKDARKKRFETIKSPRDAIRIIFRDLKIDVQMVAGNPRFDCGPCDLEFKGSKDDSDPNVLVQFVYRTHYVNEIKLTTLSIADPNFNEKVKAIIFNAQNLNKLMLGQVQPKSLDFK